MIEFQKNSRILFVIVFMTKLIIEMGSILFLMPSSLDDTETIC